MPTQITEYKCPSCTAPLRFDSGSGRLVCDYCGASFDTAEMDAQQAGKEAAAQEAFAEKEKKAADSVWDLSCASDEWGPEAEGMRAYSCPSCGAQLITEETTAATVCPYCGNNTIVPGQFGGALKPDYIIPFRLDKEAAKRALKNHYRKKIFLPRAFSADNHLEEMQGIYVPFWLFDASVEADCTFHASRSHSHREGDERVTVTEHYTVRRAGSMEFAHVPTDASRKMPDDYMDAIEPFDYSGLKPFSTAYLPGFLADKYDVPSQESVARADRRCRDSAVAALRADVAGYEIITPSHSNVRFSQGRAHYALLPVWTLRTKWQGKDYLFMMNGQTGKLVGNLPLSQTKFWALFGVLAVIFSALAIRSGVGQWLAAIFFA